jgi:methyltransferase (TIGR00027 family)
MKEVVMPAVPPSDSPVIQHVSDTAFLVAHHRAVESARPDALFADPLAARLAGDRGHVMANRLATNKISGWTVAVRTRIIDAYILEAVARGIDTVINLGAGLDTRPYRMDLPPTLNWIEVDYPDVIAFKQERLGSESPRCNLERIGLDLSQVDFRRALLAKLNARARRALVLTEGVVPYLDLAQAAGLADDLRALDHVDSWIVDYLSPETHAWRQRSGVDRQMGQAAFKFKPADWFAFFAEHGWRSREVRYLSQVGESLGRPAPFPLPIRVVMKVLRRLAPPSRRDAFGKFVGYVLLEPATQGGA